MTRHKLTTVVANCVVTLTETLNRTTRMKKMSLFHCPLRKDLLVTKKILTDYDI